MTSTSIHINKIDNNSFNSLQDDNNSDNKCTICYENNNRPIQYYKCTKLHNICNTCYQENLLQNPKSDRYGKCPTCSAVLNNECKEPANLSVCEIKQLVTKNINMHNIYIHQNYRLQKDTVVMHISNKKSEIELITSHGKPITYLNMFLCKNGFLYKYDMADECYYLAVTKNKYQFWDTKRMILNL